jgi:hypothetical protein
MKVEIIHSFLNFKSGLVRNKKEYIKIKEGIICNFLNEIKML